MTSLPDIPLKNRSLYFVGDSWFCGIGIEKILPSLKIGDGLPPNFESKPFLLKIILFIHYYDSSRSTKMLES